MNEYITIKTKDEWGRLSKMQFCVADLLVLRSLIFEDEMPPINPEPKEPEIDKAPI